MIILLYTLFRKHFEQLNSGLPNFSNFNYTINTQCTYLCDCCMKRAPGVLI